MKQQGQAFRTRIAKKISVALAITLVGSAIAASGAQATSHPAKSKYGGSVTIGIGDTFPGFCVGNIPNHSALGGFRLIYESLFERSTSGEYIGSLATGYTTNADFTEYTIKLRPGISFTNGEAFNADAVKLNLDLNSTLYSAQNPTSDPLFRTAGQGYASTGVGVNANMIDVVKLDDLTIKIVLNGPQSDFMGVIYRAGRYVMRAPSQLWDPVTKKANHATNGVAAAKSCVNFPIGTGPFTFVSYTTDSLEVVKNPNYWRKNPVNGDKLPYLDKITFINVKEPSQRSAAVRKGTVDAASFATADATFVKDLRSKKKSVIGYTAQPLWWGSWVPNIDKAGSVFTFKNCRLAVAHAIDWKSFNKVRFKGLGTVSGSIVGKGHPMFTMTNAPKFDVALAKDFAAKCRTDLAGKEFKFTLYADTSSQSQNNTKFIKSNLEAAGIMPNNTYVAEAAVLIGLIYGGPLGVTTMDITQGTPAEGDDSAYVSMFYNSTAFPVGHKSPVAQTAIGKRFARTIALSNVTDPKVDQLIIAAQAAKTPAASKVAWKEMTAYLQGEGYQIPAVHGTFYSFVNKKAKLGGIGKLPIGTTKNKFPATVTNRGLEWMGIWKG